MIESKKVLLINTHLNYPNWSEGNLNKSFYDKAKEFFLSEGYDILETAIEKGYTVEDEVEKHLQADVVILQMPVNWFGAPWIHKKYVDEVFNYGLNSQKLVINDGRTATDPTKQYGTGGKMQGKSFMISATFAAPKSIFSNSGQQLMQGKTTQDLFLNITSNYKFCGYNILDSYHTFDIYKDNTIAEDIKNYPNHLAKVLNIKAATIDG